MRAQQNIEGIPDHERKGDKQPEESWRSRRVTPFFSPGGAGFGWRRRRERICVGTSGNHCLAAGEAWVDLSVCVCLSTGGKQARQLLQVLKRRKEGYNDEIERCRQRVQEQLNATKHAGISLAAA